MPEVTSIPLNGHLSDAVNGPVAADCADAELDKLRAELGKLSGERDGLLAAAAKRGWHQALKGTFGQKPIGENPRDNGRYLVTMIIPSGRRTERALFNNGRWHNEVGTEIAVLAWMEFPEPWMG